MNRLSREKSPYLRQHADNPVDWYPWGEEAFARARAEGKPIFLSVGYSTCHWCHVMERESFANQATARLMNESFVNVKLDREERPDVDRVYMAFVQASTGGGGWPMSVFLTPNLEPFYGGTYFPPQDAHGRPGFPTLLRRIGQLWQEKRPELTESATRILGQIAESEALPVAQELGPEVVETAFAAFRKLFDAEYAGFGGAPKFPRPVVYDFLFAHHARTGEALAADMALATLVLMSRGGMYDHLGGGFHRYSVDRHWHVPHFEKMLYDQAQLVHSYVEGWQLTHDPDLARIALETCAYVVRDLTAPDGGFYSAEDADSLPPGETDPHHKKEGAFYVWSRAELDQRLGADADLFGRAYAVEPDGNAEDPHGELTGMNVLHSVSTAQALAEETQRSVSDVEQALAAARETLFAARHDRARPSRDEKVLAAWNGMMIGALARAASALVEPGLLRAAQRAATFAATTLWDGERLFRRWADGETAIDGYLDDHAQLAAGLLDLYEADFDPKWLLLAETLIDRAIARFGDTAGGFYATSGEDKSVLLRMKDDYDGAEPSGNAVMAMTLLRLAEMLDRPELRRRAEGVFAALSSRLKEIPHAVPALVAAWDFARIPPLQIVIAGEPDAADTHALLRVVRGRHLPHKVVLLADARGRAALGERLPWVAAMSALGGKATAYVCKDKACERPTTDVDELAALLPARQHA